MSDQPTDVELPSDPPGTVVLSGGVLGGTKVDGIALGWVVGTRRYFETTDGLMQTYIMYEPGMAQYEGEGMIE